MSTVVNYRSCGDITWRGRRGDHLRRWRMITYDVQRIAQTKVPATYGGTLDDKADGLITAVRPRAIYAPARQQSPASNWLLMCMP